jgi:transcriptional regulator of nitric oxide reductase
MATIARSRHVLRWDASIILPSDFLVKGRTDADAGRENVRAVLQAHDSIVAGG